MLNKETIQKIYKILGDYPYTYAQGIDSALAMTAAAFIKENISWEKTVSVIEALGEYTNPYNMLKMDYTLLVSKLSQCENPKRTAIRLKNCATHMITWGYEPEYFGQYDTDELKQRLAEIIIKDEEIIDFILLYVHNRSIFPADKSVVRVFSRIDDEFECENISRAVISALEGKTQALREFHSKICALVEDRCTDKHPACIKCPLLQICAKAGAM